jgi:chorismate-pyruvate lyase
MTAVPAFAVHSTPGRFRVPYLRRLAVGLTSAALLCARSAAAQQPAAWPDSYVSRLQAFALMQSLNAEILASRSATTTLERWCRDHRLAAEPRIIAERVSVDRVAPTEEQRARLMVADSEEVRYRRVRLRCGDHVLSEAENWYVPGRLTPEMNRLLETTETPFGRVVQPLGAYRRTFSAGLLWEPLPPGWDRSLERTTPCASSGPLRIPGALFEHRAVLYGSDQRPFSEVHEIYQGQVLAFAPPAAC